MRSTFVLKTERERGFALAAVMRARVGDKPDQVRISRPTRTNEQNSHLHSILTDIADQLGWPPDTGELHSINWWKRVLTLQWLIDSKSQPDLVSSLDGLQVAILLPHTSDLDIPQCAALIEFVYSFGAPRGVVFKEPKREEPPVEAYEDAR